MSWNPKYTINIGDKFHKLTVIDTVEPIAYRNGLASAKLCQCECGNKIIVADTDLRQGRRKSCGCMIGGKSKTNSYIIHKDKVEMFASNNGISFFIDLEDLDKCLKHCWRANFYQSGKVWRIKTNDKTTRKTIYLSKYLLGTTENQVVDHIDRNPLNNCKSNLRIVNCMQNIWNTKTKNYYLRKSTKYLVKINVNGVEKKIGYAETELQAHHMAYQARHNLLKEYAWDWLLTEEESWSVLHNDTSEDERQYADIDKLKDIF